MSSPATAARTTLIDLIVDEFADDMFAVRPDRLDESLGFDGGVIGVAPNSEMPNPQNRTELITSIVVQFYGPWSPESDPNDIVDPSTVEDWAWRFRMMIDGYTQTPTSEVWWFQLEGIEYGDDPTGNCTRFVAEVTAHGANPTL